MPLQSAFESEFGFAVGISGNRWILLFNRLLFRLPIDRGGRREYEATYSRLSHQVQQCESGTQVVVIVLRWILDRFTYQRVRCHMNNSLDFFLAQRSE